MCIYICGVKLWNTTLEIRQLCLDLRKSTRIVCYGIMIYQIDYLLVYYTMINHVIKCNHYQCLM